MASQKILAINPFHGGSHRQFLNAVSKHSRHQWSVVAGKPVHWKWRMRSSPLELAAVAQQQIAEHDYPDVVFCTDMLDLPQWRGLLRDPRILQTPTVAYFHENQLTYPVSPHAKSDSHFGYTNLLTAFAADECWFNSEFHRTDFMKAGAEFVQRMPDAQAAHDFDALRTRTRVMPPGFEPPPQVASEPDSSGPIRLGWVSRWEYDKRPDQFLELLKLLEQGQVDFELILLGARPKAIPHALAEIRESFADRILHDGFAESSHDYARLLGRMDVVISTADHEFFGIAVCEAIWAGAAPMLPNRLSYPELVAPESIYDSLAEAASKIQELGDRQQRRNMRIVNRQRMEPLQIENVVIGIDDAIEDLQACLPTDPIQRGSETHRIHRPF
ncbi:MAG: DUF3524 domain-containing protein [Rubripirellula sp.]